MIPKNDCHTYFKTCSSAPSPTDSLIQSPTESPTQSSPVVSGCTGSRCAGTDRCDESSWPDKDHNLVCADCKVLVNHFSSKYRTCSGYCSHIGRRCVGAWEEQGDTCSVLHNMTCDQALESSDAICECSPEQPSAEGVECLGQYGQMEHVVAEEGNDVGSLIRTSSADDCQQECDANAACKSFTLCPGWAKCWMKDRSLNGGESMSQNNDCRTYYKTCSSALSPTDLPTQSPGESPTQSPANSPTQSPPVQPGCTGPSCTIKVMSYNTEYRDYNNRMAGYADKIKEVAPAIVGLQECQNRDGLARLTGYTANMETERQNYMLFDPQKVTLLSGGWMPIPRDDYAPRAITWASSCWASERCFSLT